MAITRLQTIPKFKPSGANIYLDDLEEIINILKPDGEDQPPKLKFAVGDNLCDSIDDLRQLGGTATDFQMRVQWQKNGLRDELEFNWYGRAEMWLSGSLQRNAWVLSQVSDIFRRRVTWLGKAPRLVMGVLFLVILMVNAVFLHFVHALLGNGLLHWISIFGFGSLVGTASYLFTCGAFDLWLYFSVHLNTKEAGLKVTVTKSFYTQSLPSSLP